MSWALAGLITGGAAGGCGAGAFFATFFGGAGLAVTFVAPSDVDGTGAAGVGGADGAPAAASSAARSRRATGASTVLDADFTYSPIS
jgi:hypothetical protein